MCVNKLVCITVTGSLLAPIIDRGQVTVVGRYLGRVVYSDTHDLCTLLGSSGSACPIPTTVTSITICFLVKSNAPLNIPVDITFQVTNGNGNVIFCVKVVMNIVICPN
ncbi:hypothetical protein BGX31_001027 [Mortierella sp. GBA43]|nr:hypothetical protein BGX31_001027 [Mortierella sp. GBA43]